MNPDALAILIATCIAFGIGLILTFVVPGPDKALNRVIVWTSMICVWLMWLCTYSAQVNPLGNPEMKEAD